MSFQEFPCCFKNKSIWFKDFFVYIVFVSFFFQAELEGMSADDDEDDDDERDSPTQVQWKFIQAKIL